MNHICPHGTKKAYLSTVYQISFTLAFTHIIQ